VARAARRLGYVEYLRDSRAARTGRWPRCSGRGQSTTAGPRRQTNHALSRLRRRREAGTFTCCNGSGQTVATGTQTRGCYAVARGGHLDVLQWARTNGCDWSAASRYGRRGVDTSRCCSGRGPTAAIGTGAPRPSGGEGRAPHAATVGVARRLPLGVDLATACRRHARGAKRASGSWRSQPDEGGGGNAHSTVSLHVPHGSRH
jgi:hypothetical protein